MALVVLGGWSAGKSPEGCARQGSSVTALLGSQGSSWLLLPPLPGSTPIPCNEESPQCGPGDGLMSSS